MHFPLHPETPPEGRPLEELFAGRDVIAERRFKDAVDADWAKSRQFGVTGVPTFVAEGRAVVGAQPYEMLVQLMSNTLLR